VAGDVRRAEIEEALERALGTRRSLTRCEPLVKGHGHQSFVLETSSGPALLLKIARRREQLDRMRSLGRVLELAARHRIPVPQLLHVSEGTALFEGRPWLIQEFLEGEDGEAALARMSVAERAAFFRDFGAAVARLHAIDLGYFAEDLASSPREPTWTAAVEARVEHLKTRHAGVGVVSPAHLEAAGETILTTARAEAPAVRPALVHRDLYLPNTLVAAGRFRCLLDFEHARSADAITDFVKLGMWVFEKIPGAASDFGGGYGSNPLATKDGRRRHHVALGLELLAGLLYWTTTGETAMLADYRRRFDRWFAEA
jgi:aminoglycoside phosphotransferase (APT) family kinase protein